MLFTHLHLYITRKDSLVCQCDYCITESLLLVVWGGSVEGERGVVDSVVRLNFIFTCWFQVESVPSR
jgi:hypothetical protein